MTSSTIGWDLNFFFCIPLQNKNRDEAGILFYFLLVSEFFFRNPRGSKRAEITIKKNLKFKIQKYFIFPVVVVVAVAVHQFHHLQSIYCVHALIL